MPAEVTSPNRLPPGRRRPATEIETATTALHGLVDGLAIRLLINPGPDFRRQALRVIETTIDDLRRGRGQRA